VDYSPPVRRHAFALLLIFVLPALAADMTRGEVAGLRFSVPRAWDRVPARSDVTTAQWKLPRAPGDSEDGQLVLLFLGTEGGGSTQENLDRWYGHFTQPDGRLTRDAATVTTRTVNGLTVTAVDVAGTYKAGPTNSGPLPPPKRGYRMLAAAIEGEGGPWYLEAIGPEKTIAAAKPGFEAMLASLTPHR
jgi:hypothetical protein